MNVLGLKRGFLHLKVAPRSQKWPKLAKKTPKLTSKLLPSTLAGDPTAVTLATNKLYFYQMTLGKDIRDQEGIPALKVAPLPTKRPESAKKLQNHP